MAIEDELSPEEQKGFHLRLRGSFLEALNELYLMQGFQRVGSDGESATYSIRQLKKVQKEWAKRGIIR